MNARPVSRRRLLAAFGVLGAGAMGALASARIFNVRAERPGPGADLCRTPSRFDNPLRVPRNDGLLGRLVVGERTLVLRATSRGRNGMLVYAALAGGREYLDPTLVVKTGTRVRLKLDNALDEPTITHWHGLTVDSANDGNGERLALPGRSFDYDFTVRNRAGLYWYHPHPHGATAAQVYRGLFGLLAVEDDEEIALRRALALSPGDTEIPLVLHDLRSATRDRYAPSAEDLVHGVYGDEVLVNFTSRPFLDVAGRRYRFRVINASNARIYRLALRRDDGSLLPFHLIGTDGGLLERPVRVEDVFVATAERIDILVDFSGVAKGGFVMLESRAFDPMHAELEASPQGDASAHAGHVHGGSTATPGAPASGSDGGAFAILQFRVRERGGVLAPLPTRLSVSAAIPPPGPVERPLSLAFAKGRWRINDLVFDMNDAPIVVARAAVETWVIQNAHASMPHAMHLHGFQFRVLERRASPDQLAPLVIDERGRVSTDTGWKDTVLVWPGETVRVAIDFRHPFEGEQIYLFHCHNLEHEDGGMMLRVKVG
jgi:blue copper oxidase